MKVIVFIAVAVFGLYYLHGKVAAQQQKGSGVVWRELEVTGRPAACVPDAVSQQAQSNGLQFQERPRYPLVFTWSRPARQSFWMKDTPVVLAGVWVRAGRVVGYWHGVPESLSSHKSPGPVTMVIEYPPGKLRPPSRHGRVQLGSTCPTRAAL